MKLNRKWLMVIALVLSLTMAISGTLAYLTDRDTVENVFTMGNVDIEVEEVFPDGNIKPGVTVNKDAKITNEGSNPAWVWMTVSVAEGLKDYVTMNWANGFIPTSDSPVVKDGQVVCPSDLIQHLHQRIIAADIHLLGAGTVSCKCLQLRLIALRHMIPGVDQHDVSTGGGEVVLFSVDLHHALSHYTVFL